MKTTEYSCDHCKRKYANDAEIISLGSKDGFTLYYKNPHTEPYQIKDLNHYHDLHFCNRDCFTNYFFNTDLTTNKIPAYTSW